MNENLIGEGKPQERQLNQLEHHCYLTKHTDGKRVARSIERCKHGLSITSARAKQRDELPFSRPEHRISSTRAPDRPGPGRGRRHNARLVLIPVSCLATRSDEQLVDCKVGQAAGGVAPRNRSTVNESPHPAELGQGLHNETNQPHTRADHPQAKTAELVLAQGKTIADV